MVLQSFFLFCVFLSAVCVLLCTRKIINEMKQEKNYNAAKFTDECRVYAKTRIRSQQAQTYKPAAKFADPILCRLIFHQLLNYRNLHTENFSVTHNFLPLFSIYPGLDFSLCFVCRVQSLYLTWRRRDYGRLTKWCKNQFLHHIVQPGDLNVTVHSSYSFYAVVFMPNNLIICVYSGMGTRSNRLGLAEKF